MSDQRTEQLSNQPSARPMPLHDGEEGHVSTRKELAPQAEQTNAALRKEAEATQPQSKPKPTPKPRSEAKLKMRSHLPALDDDADGGVQKEQIVTRDGKADLGFTGTLLASAAPETTVKDHWEEYRIYATNGGKHVFSKVTRTVFADEEDAYEAEVFDPSPSSVSSQLFRSARDLARSHPVTWMDAAVDFFGYDPLAKALYRKLSVGFEEQIS